MIESNLSVLLAERNLKITKVSRDTGISRTTLTALCYDHTAGIKFETLDTLCRYLSITPQEFFNYNPYDYRIDFDEEIFTYENDPEARQIDCNYNSELHVSRHGQNWVLPVRVHTIVALPLASNGMLIEFIAKPKDLQSESEFAEMKKIMSLAQRTNFMMEYVKKAIENTVCDIAEIERLSESEVILDNAKVAFLTDLADHRINVSNNQLYKYLK